MTTRVSIDELRQAALLLLDHLEALDQREFQLDDDYYWCVSENQRYKPYEEPTEHTVGQLSDDLMEIRRMLQKEREPVGRGLVWLAALLRRVGEKAIG